MPLSNAIPLLIIIMGTVSVIGCDAKPTGESTAIPSPATSQTVAAQDAQPAISPVIKPAASPSTEKPKNDPQVAKSVESAAKLSTPKEPPRPSAEQLSKWKSVNYEPLQLLACYDDFKDHGVQAMAISPSGEHFVLAGAKLTLWNTKNSEPLLNLLAQYDGNEVKRPLRTVAISPDGKWIAAGDLRGKVRIWNLSDQVEVVNFNAHEGYVAELAFSPESRVLATTSYAGEVRLWQLPEGKKLKNLKVSDQGITRLVFLSENQLAVSGTEAATIWNLETGDKQTTLTKKNVIGPALGLSRDHHWLAFNDSDLVLQLWDVRESKLTGRAFRGAGAHLVDFSHDGKWIATYSQHSNIQIWDVASGRVVQVIDADGDRTSALQWLPGCNGLLAASEQGLLRIWGTPAIAQTIGIQPIKLPNLESKPASDHRSLTSAQFQRVIDIRSFPRLPGAVPQWSDFGVSSYVAPVTQEEAELFYRHMLDQSGWTEAAPTVATSGSLVFHKEDCELNLTLAPAIPGIGDHRDGDLQVNLQFAGNYDVRWLPKFKPIESKGTWDSFSSVGYRTNAELIDVEVGLLKLLHEAGWTAYSRLNAVGIEDPNSRQISLLQGGSVLTVFIRHPADSPEELFIQTSVNVSNKSLPIPSDSGWIEFDSSTNLLLVANTKMDLEQTAQFYEKQMSAEGWLGLESGTKFKDDKGWMPFIRGQQDVFIRLMALPEGGTRIFVGDVGNSSWQLQKATPSADGEKTDQVGIEAADFKLPPNATAVKFDVDSKTIEFVLADAKPQILGEHFVKQMEALEWKRDGAGIIDDDYVFITFAKNKMEIQLRARMKDQNATGAVSGDGLLWNKPLPAAPVRVSYGTWLRRGLKNASLNDLNAYAAEMHLIPVTK